MTAAAPSDALSSGPARRWTGGRLVVATHNPGKLHEIRALLSAFPVEALSAADLGLAAPEETEPSCIGNAKLKARHAAMAANLPSLADDSGLEVAALDGRPGVHTADWAETPTGRDFGLAMRKVHDALTALEAARPWRARFVSVLSLTWPDGHDETVLGVVDGQLTWPPRGQNGHGYDPMFVREGETETFGELTTARKQERDHRSSAFAQLVERVFAASEQPQGEPL